MKSPFFGGKKVGTEEPPPQLGQNPKFFQKVHLRAPLRREGKRETDTRREGKRETDIKREGKKRNRHKKGRKKERKKECQSGMISLVCLCLAVAWEAAKTILDCHFQNLAVVVIYHLPFTKLESALQWRRVCEQQGGQKDPFLLLASLFQTLQHGVQPQNIKLRGGV